MDDVAAIVYEKIVADAQESASASRVVLTYRDVGVFDTMEVIIRRVAHRFYAFNHVSKETVCTITAKNFSCEAEMIVARMRDTIDSNYAYSRAVKVLHDTPDDECIILWQANTVFDGISHDEPTNLCSACLAGNVGTRQIHD